MASLTQLPSGNWRVQVRRKNRYVSETFRRRKEALGALKLPKLNREPLIEFGRQRAKEGAGRATLAIDFSFMPVSGASSSRMMHFGSRDKTRYNV